MTNIPHKAKVHEGYSLVMSSIPALKLVKRQIFMNFDCTWTAPGMNPPARHASYLSLSLTTPLTNPPFGKLLSLQDYIKILCSPREPFFDKVILSLNKIFS